jgi:alanine-glyoxylate transaminase/serine-glyoxylate transaminase/serine-pyruvate transaminase
MYETGHFAALWQKLATRLGLKTEVIGYPGADVWRHGVQAS